MGGLDRGEDLFLPDAAEARDRARLEVGKIRECQLFAVFIALPGLLSLRSSAILVEELLELEVLAALCRIAERVVGGGAVTT